MFENKVVVVTGGAKGIGRAIAEEFREMGAVLTAAMLVLGNLTFFLLDRLLSRDFRRKK